MVRTDGTGDGESSKGIRQKFAADAARANLTPTITTAARRCSKPPAP